MNASLTQQVLNSVLFTESQLHRMKFLYISIIKNILADMSLPYHNNPINLSLDKLWCQTIIILTVKQKTEAERSRFVIGIVGLESRFKTCKNSFFFRILRTWSIQNKCKWPFVKLGFKGFRLNSTLNIMSGAIIMPHKSWMLLSEINSSFPDTWWNLSIF